MKGAAPLLAGSCVGGRKMASGQIRPSPIPTSSSLSGGTGWLPPGGWQLVRHGVDAGDVQGFFDAHARQDTRHGPRQQGLTGTRGADEQHVVDNRQ